MTVWKRLATHTQIPSLWLWLYRRKLFTFVIVFPFVFVTTVWYISTIHAKNDLAWRPTFVNLSDHNFIQNNEEICKQISSPLVVTLVHSARSHVAYRKVIRETWGSVTSLKHWAFRTVFILGGDTDNSQDSDSDWESRSNLNRTLDDEIQVESKTYGDMIISDFHDSYRNMTIKHLSGYKWVLKYCPNAAFVVKTDDDVFVNQFQLVELLNAKLEDQKTHTHQISCHQWEDTPKPYGKWKVTSEEYRGNAYPYFCIGAAYITTPRLIRSMYQFHSHVPYFWIDDIFVTGILRTYYNSVVAKSRIKIKISANASSQFSSHLPDTALARGPQSRIDLDNISDLYQLQDDACVQHKIFYLLKRQDDVELDFDRMYFYWVLAIAQHNPAGRNLNDPNLEHALICTACRISMHLNAIYVVLAALAGTKFQSLV